MKKLIINCQLEYEIPENIVTEEEIIEFGENVELPKEYVTDSFELRGVWNEEKAEYETYF